jgi:hypothetical protein
MTSIYLLQEYIRPQETGCKPANMPHVTDAAWEKKNTTKVFWGYHIQMLVSIQLPKSED